MAQFVWQIGEGTAQLSISDPGKWEYSKRAVVLDNGKIDSIEHTITMELSTIGTTSEVIDALGARADELAANKLARRVYLELDGVVQEEYDFKPAAGFIGPLVTSFEVVPARGNFSSHGKYRLVIFFRSKGTDGEVFELRRSLETVKRNGKVIRKVWSVSCRSGSYTSAQTKCMNYKPAITEILESVKPFIDEARCEAVWIWEAGKTTTGIIATACHVSGPMPGATYVAVPRAGQDNPPHAHRLLDKEGYVDIHYTIFSRSPAIIAHAAHCQEGDDIIRLPGEEERPSEVEWHGDPKDGVYKRTFHERYMVLGVSPVITHSDDHQLATFATPPSDGGITS